MHGIPRDVRYESPIPKASMPNPTWAATASCASAFAYERSVPFGGPPCELMPTLTLGVWAWIHAIIDGMYPDAGSAMLPTNAFFENPRGCAASPRGPGDTPLQTRVASPPEVIPNRM